VREAHAGHTFQLSSPSVSRSYLCVKPAGLRSPACVGASVVLSSLARRRETPRWVSRRHPPYPCLGWPSSPGVAGRLAALPRCGVCPGAQSPGRSPRRPAGRRAQRQRKGQAGVYAGVEALPRPWRAPRLRSAPSLRQRLMAALGRPVGGDQLREIAAGGRAWWGQSAGSSSALRA
jgi:hypothetical protein